MKPETMKRACYKNTDRVPAQYVVADFAVAWRDLELFYFGRYPNIISKSSARQAVYAVRDIWVRQTRRKWGKGAAWAQYQRLVAYHRANSELPQRLQLIVRALKDSFPENFPEGMLSTVQLFSLSPVWFSGR